MDLVLEEYRLGHDAADREDECCWRMTTLLVYLSTIHFTTELVQYFTPMNLNMLFS